MNNEPSQSRQPPREEPIQGAAAQIVAGIGAAAGFGLVTWWQSGEVGLTVIMAIAAFIVAFGVSRISQSRRR